ncbi:lysozyme inhibitor LprI family protein [Mangrovibrevibacter kandeliae]|uniref:lysozyme inhibitor LprI family protein n=1 Tax=Mangrovibrevibacter kandeliae TaxID=2968473 RepID=UPI0021185C53|nr:lysozyme inhibitor LprI family protein [Aurantimonas sp. CSK15Z-1]MCQ8784047.1 lysozyme inhibitor LprI family protein [Aurantimonas sp. CSK15Z-1]
MRSPAALASLAAGFVLVADASSATAQTAADPAVRADRKAIEACLAKAGDDPRSCIGQRSDACQDKTKAVATDDIAACIDREQSAWDAILNERYRRATADAKATDKELGDSGIDAGAATSLVAAQRAWIAFRDAECDRLYALDAGGTIRTLTYASCELDLTAQRAIDLAPRDE